MADALPADPADDVVADGKQVKMLLDTLASVLAEMGVMGDESEAASADEPSVPSGRPSWRNCASGPRASRARSSGSARSPPRNENCGRC
jgi:hypothetical protein